MKLSPRLLQRVLSPNPNWSVGQKQPSPFKNQIYSQFDPASTPTYGLTISGVVPRPIAFISTVSKTGTGNLAPFSYFNAVAHDPPTVCIGITRSGRNGAKKDTLVNIEETGEFVVNIISEWMVESANHCSGDFSYGVDEAQLVGYTLLPSERVQPPRIGESAFHMECKVTDIKQVKNKKDAVTSDVVFGEVVLFHVMSDLVELGPRNVPQVNLENFRPLGRLGGEKWAIVNDFYDIPRPKVGKK